VRELSPKRLRRFREELERAGTGAATTRKMLAIVQSILSFAVAEEVVRRLAWGDVGKRTIRYADTKRRRARTHTAVGAVDRRPSRVVSGLGSSRARKGCAPAGTRPRDLRSSFIALRVYEGIPLTQIAREVGTSVRMIEERYAGVIANWDGQHVPAEDQIRAARQTRQT